MIGRVNMERLVRCNWWGAAAKTIDIKKLHIVVVTQIMLLLARRSLLGLCLNVNVMQVLRKQRQRLGTKSPREDSSL